MCGLNFPNDVTLLDPYIQQVSIEAQYVRCPAHIDAQLEHRVTRKPKQRPRTTP
jgi:hypothetical protein